MGFADLADLKKILTAHKINVPQLGGNNDSEPNMIYSEELPVSLLAFSWSPRGQIRRGTEPTLSRGPNVFGRSAGKARRFKVEELSF